MEIAHKSPNGPFEPAAEARDAPWTSKSLRCPPACLPQMTFLDCARRKAGTDGLPTEAHSPVADSAVTLPHIRSLNWSG